MTSDELLRAGENLTQQSCTLELLLRPAEVKFLYTILSFYAPNHPGQFLVRQWTDGLLVSHDVADDRNKIKIKRRKIDVDHCFEVGKILLLTIVSGPNGNGSHKNGLQAKLFVRSRFRRANCPDRSGWGLRPSNISLGWEVRGSAIYSSRLTPAQVVEHYKAWTEARESIFRNPTPLPSTASQSGRVTNSTMPRTLDRISRYRRTSRSHTKLS